MALVHPVNVRNAVADFVLARINAGAGAGVLEFQTAANVEVATLSFADPAFNPAVNGSANAAPIAPDSTATGGTIAKARAKDSNGIEVFACSVTTVGGGGDIQLNSVNIAAGQQVSLTTLIYTATP